MIDRLLQLLRRIPFYLRRDRYEAEFKDELDFHRQLRVDELRHRGVPEHEAIRQARLALGNQAVIQEAARDVWLVRWAETLRRDVTVAVRSLAKAPGFTAVALLTLALGIGGTTAIFSLLNALLFKPLPFREPDQLVNLFITARESPAEPSSQFPWSYPKFDLVRRSATAFDGVAGFGVSNLNLVIGGEPERVSVEEVTGDYFRVLGAGAVLGRTLTRTDDSIPKAHPVVVLSHALWRRRFAADSGVIGRAVTLGGEQLTVIGVGRPGFAGLSGGADLWIPMMMTPVFEYSEILNEAGNHWFGAVARLADGVPIERARAEMALLGGQADARYRPAEQKTPWSATAEPLADIRVDPAIRRASWILFGATALVLLIGCLNLANLLLVRSNVRRREIAVRQAIGADRGAIVRHLLVESSLLSLVGGGLGLVLARFGGGAMAALGPRSEGGPGGTSYLFAADATAVDFRVLLFALGASLVTGLAVGLWPAWRAGRYTGPSLLSGQRLTAAGPRTGFGASNLLVAIEAALAVVLVTGAVLMVKSFSKLTNLDLGFHGDRVVTFRVAPGSTDLAGRDPIGFRTRALESLAALPGVESASSNLCPPIAGRCAGSIVVRVDDRRLTDAFADRRIGIQYVSPGYFETLKIERVAGRVFDDRDRVGAPRVVLVNQTAAAKLWPGQDPVGRTIAVATGYFGGGDSLATVVGVVADVRYDSADQPAGMDVYVPALATTFGPTTFLIRTAGNPLGSVEAARKAIRTVDPGLPIFSVRTMDEISRVATSRTRFATTLLSLFSSMALLLAALGVYGVLAYSVASRSREIGIRMALGAEQQSVVGLVLRQGMLPIGVGLFLGLGGAVAVTRVLRGLLYGVEPSDPGSFAIGAAALAAAGLIASYLPARRAARVDPITVLRIE